MTVAPSETIRVFHTIAGLSGGGLERWLVDIVRLSDPHEVEHRVFVLYPDLGGSPVYGGVLASRGVFHASRLGLRTRVLSALTKRGRARKTTGLHGRLSFVSRTLACLVALPRAIRLLKQFDPHVIHAHSGPDILLGVMLKARFGLPLVHTVPCLFSQMRMEGLPWLPSFYRRAHDQIDIFSTGESRTELLDLGVPEEKIVYDLGGVDLTAACCSCDDWNSSRENLLRHLQIPADGLLALSVGRLHLSKGHNYAIEALHRLRLDVPQLHLLIMGEGSERRALMEQVRQLKVADRIHLLGFVPNPRPIYGAADIYLRPAILEPENLSFYEAMAAGLPVVGFDTGWPDLITKASNGRLVPMQDVAAFASAVRDILRLPDRGQSLGQNGRRYANANLNVNASVDLLSKTYRRLHVEHRSGTCA